MNDRKRMEQICSILFHIQMNFATSSNDNLVVWKEGEAAFPFAIKTIGT